MVTRMSLLMCGYVILAIVGLLSALLAPWHLLTATAVGMLFVLLTVSIPLHLAWSRNNFGFLVSAFVISILFGILEFAIIYKRTGLVADGSIRSVSFAEAVYFSVTTWTTLGYGDYTAPIRFQLVTSVEVLTGYFAMGVFIALVALWLSESLRAYDAYLQQLPALAREAARELAENSPGLGETLRPLIEERKPNA